MAMRLMLGQSLKLKQNDPRRHHRQTNEQLNCRIAESVLQCRTPPTDGVSKFPTCFVISNRCG